MSERNIIEARAREWLSKRTRPLTLDEAKKSATRLINYHFHNEDRAKIQIPAHPDDDDLFLMAYLDSTAALAPQGEPLGPEDEVIINDVPSGLRGKFSLPEPPAPQPLAEGGINFEKNCGICGLKPHRPSCRIAELEAELSKLRADNEQLREQLYDCIVELSYCQSAETLSMVPSAKGKDLVDKGMKLLGVTDLTAETWLAAKGSHETEH